MQRRTFALIGAVVMGAGAAIYFALMNINANPQYAIGDVVDELNGVPVHFNGAINHNEGRNTSPDGYNIGIRYQCVEFVKRYYYVRFGHRMPDTHGNAKDFFDPRVADGALNTERNLVQFRNGGANKPAPDDLVVFGPWLFNRYGHVAIVAGVTDDAIEIVQQNPGPFGASRETYALTQVGGAWTVGHDRLLGWLRLPPPVAQPAVARR